MKKTIIAIGILTIFLIQVMCTVSAESGNIQGTVKIRDPENPFSWKNQNGITVEVTGILAPIYWKDGLFTYTYSDVTHHTDHVALGDIDGYYELVGASTFIMYMVIVKDEEYGSGLSIGFRPSDFWHDIKLR